LPTKGSTITKAIVAACVALVSSAVFALVDQVQVSSLTGTAFHDGGWFSCKTDAYDDGSVRLDTKEEYLLAPHYGAPVRKIVLNVRATETNPTRVLRIVPFVNGVGTADERLIRTIASFHAAGSNEYVTVDFSLSDQVDSFWIMLGGSGSSGVWGIRDICVFYGEWQEEEDRLLRDFAGQLPSPAHVRAGDFTETSLEILADPVEGAVGYRFQVSRLEGTPQTTAGEDFNSIADDFGMSEGWSLASSNAVLTACTESSNTSYVDTKGSSVKRALKIEKGNLTSEPVCVEILSPSVSAPIVSYSFVSKRASGDASNAVSVFGRIGETAEWRPLGQDLTVGTTMKTTEGTVDRTNDVRQLKFVFSAQPATCRPCALDTLRVVYGGDEDRITVEDGTAAFAEPRCVLSPLQPGRYAYRVLTVGSTLRDSDWSEEGVIDLRWSSISVSAPENIQASSANGVLTVAWDAVENAEAYLVTVASADDPSAVVVKETRVELPTFSTSVPSIGEYAIEITALSPGGKSTASAGALGEVTLDQLGSVTVEALDSRTVRAKWKELPLAEGYQAVLFRIGGDAETVELGWQGDENGVVLPDGWEAQVSWGQKSWASGSQVYPALDYSGCWIASGDGGKPVTRLVCRFKCGSSSKSVITNTALRVDVADSSGTWRSARTCAVTTKLDEFVMDFPAADDVRRVRFSAESANSRIAANVRLGVVSLTYGEERPVEVASQGVTDGEAQFSDLDPTGRYRVTVTPQPSEGCTGASGDIDLAAEKFRQDGALPIGGLKGGHYVEDFSALADVSGDIETRKCGLDYWQFYKASGEAEKLLFTTGTNRTTSGVYVFGDEAGGRAVGTLASGTTGCMIGLAFRNDLGAPVGLLSLSFDWIQRNRRENASTNVLEYLITDGVSGLGAQGSWQEIPMGVTPPETAASGAGEEIVQHCEISEGLPPGIPVGGVLILRWRHDKVKAGPMMALDNVKADFSGSPGFGIIIR